MSRRRCFAVLLMTGLVVGKGCTLPDYYTPCGYSSTYHQRLSESATDWQKPSLWKSTVTRCRDKCLNGLPWLTRNKDRRDRHVGRRLQLAETGRPY